MIVMIVGGPNQRVDFHDDPVEEFFYQLRGDMILKIAENGEIYDVPIREGEVFMLPPHARHSPQRPVEGSIGLVVESPRLPEHKDGFEWFCFECGGLVHRIEVAVKDIVKDLPPLYDAFYADATARTCPACGAVQSWKGATARMGRRTLIALSRSVFCELTGVTDDANRPRVGPMIWVNRFKSRADYFVVTRR